MADKEMKAEIKVGIESNLDEVNNKLVLITEQSNEVKQALSDGFNNPLEVTQEYLDQIRILLDNLHNNIDGLKVNDIISKERIDIEKNNLSDLEAQYVSLKLARADALENNIPNEEHITLEFDVDDSEFEDYFQDEELSADQIAKINIEQFNTQASEFKQAIEEGLNNPIEVTKDKLNDLKKLLKNISTSVSSNKKILPTEDLDAQKAKVKELEDQYKSLEQARTDAITKDINDKFNSQYDDIKKNIEAISSTDLKDSRDQLDALKNSIKDLNSLTSSNKKILPTEDLDAQKAKVKELEDQYNSLKQARTDALNDRADQFSHVGLMSYLNKKVVLNKQTEPVNIPDNVTEQLNELNNQFENIKSNIDTNGITPISQEAIDNINEARQGLRSLDNEAFDLVFKKDINGNTFFEIIHNINELKNAFTGLVDSSGLQRLNDELTNTAGQSDQETSRIIDAFELLEGEFKSVEGAFQVLDNKAKEFQNTLSSGFKDSYFGFDNPEDNLKVFDINPNKTEPKDHLADLSKLAEGLGINLGSLATKFSAAAIAGLAIKGVKAAYKEFNETLSEVLDYAGKIGDGISDGIDIVIDVIERLVDKAVEAAEKIKDLADLGVELQQKWFTAYNYLGGQAGTEINSFISSLEQMYGLDGDKLIGSLRSISSAVQNIGLDAENSAKAVKAFEQLGIETSAFTGLDYDSITNSIQSAVNMGYIGRNSPLVKALGLTKSDVELFKSLNTEQERANFILSKGQALRGTYEKWLNTSAGKVQTLNNSISRLNGNTQLLATGLVSKIAPALTAIVNLINQLVVVISKILHIDLRSADSNMADISSEFSGLSDNIDNVTESADEAKRHLASFDDVIQINDSNNTLDTDAIDDLNSLGNIDLSGWDLEEPKKQVSELEKQVEEFLKLLEDGDFFGAGKYLNETITDWLDGIKWDDIRIKISSIVTNITGFLNGLFENQELFRKIGGNIAELFNTVVIAIRDFVGTIKWDNIGKALSQSWNGFWNKFDSRLLGTSLFLAIHGAFEAFWSFVDDMLKTDELSGMNGFQIVGFKITDTINTFFGHWTQDDIIKAANSIIDFIDGVFQALGTFISTLNTYDIKLKIQTFIHNLFTGFVEHAEEWGAIIGEFIDFIVDMLDTLISEYDSTGLGEALKAFVENTNIEELVLKVIQMKIKAWWEKLKILGWTEFKGVVGTIDLFLSEIISFIDEACTNAQAYLQMFGAMLGGTIIAFGTVIKECVSELFDWIGEKVDWLIDKLSFLKDFWTDSFTNGNFFDNWKTGLDMISPFSISGGTIVAEVEHTLPSIPMLANGGIVRQATQLIAGEAGDEAVLPLQNNTGWMDVLASKTAQQLSMNNNNNMSMQSVVIDMSKSIKPVYTRSEMLAFGKQVAEALKVYGVAVSVIQ